MANEQKTPGRFRRGLKLFLLILLALLVPMVIDQADMDRETLRTAGRVAAGLAVALLLFGIVTKAIKIMGFFVLILITLVFLVAEGTLKAPRVKDWVAEHRTPK